MRFLKLDTGVVDGFDAALSPDVRVVNTGTGAILKGLSAHFGVVGAVSRVTRAVVSQGSEARAQVQGNLDRKRIRVPQIFGNPVVAEIYGYVKRVQARLLQQVLEAEIAAHSPEVVIVYNGSLFPESVLADRSTGHPRVFVEAGFFPGTLQIDPVGLNGANSVPRDPGFYLDPAQDFAAAGLPELVNNRASKSRYDPISLDPGYVFVPFQVPSDMQVTVQSPWIKDMEMFQDAICDLADRHPDEVFVIKEHPSFKRSVIGRRDHPRVLYANGNVTSDLIRDARAVITLNSTVGIESLLLDRPVITLGHACYNIEGLVQQAKDAGALDAALRDVAWAPDPVLRQQFIGYLWNRYLVHGRYDDLPADLADQIVGKASKAVT